MLQVLINKKCWKLFWLDEYRNKFFGKPNKLFWIIIPFYVDIVPICFKKLNISPVSFIFDMTDVMEQICLIKGNINNTENNYRIFYVTLRINIYALMQIYIDFENSNIRTKIVLSRIKLFMYPVRT